MTRKRSAYRPRLVQAPIMRELHDQIALGLHLSYEVVARAPNLEVVEHLAQILGMVGLAVENDPKFVDESRTIDSAMRALDQIASSTAATDLELAPLLLGVRAADAVVPRLDVIRLHKANLKLRALAVL